jgi:hypothetical protein
VSAALDELERASREYERTPRWRLLRRWRLGREVAYWLPRVHGDELARLRSRRGA